MSVAPGPLWPWLALVGLGVFHGINPAMGWLFAVALGLHRRSRRIVLLSWIPIAIGHAGAVALVLFVVLALGLVVDSATLSRAAAAMLLGWALWHAVRGHRQRLRVGMQTGLAGLALWSFLMSSAHGAGLMLIPVLLPLCLSGSPSGQLTASGSLPVALAALGVHTAAMLATITAVSLIVYEWVGVAFLRSGWVNLDLIWIAALGTCGALLMLA
jgi:hypothetical protein